MLRGNELPDFVDQIRSHEYSTDFDDDVMDEVGPVSCESSCSIPEEFQNNVSISNSSFQVPKLTPAKTHRKTWKLTESFERPVWTKSNIERTSSNSSISGSNSDENQESAATQLRNLNRNRREKNWLEESWNLISEFERNNKGRKSLVISLEPDNQVEENIPEAIIEVNNFCFLRMINSLYF